MEEGRTVFGSTLGVVGLGKAVAVTANLKRGHDMNRTVPNHKIDGLVSGLEPFTNYNGTITAWHDSSGEYVVKHWNTEIIRYDTKTRQIADMAYWFISQTTSTLVGRLLRNLPEDAVDAYIKKINSDDRKRLARMLSR